jgi:hypothetical protein
MSAAVSRYDRQSCQGRIALQSIFFVVVLRSFCKEGIDEVPVPF